MAVQFRSVSTAVSNSATTLSPSKPSQTADGDVLIAVTYGPSPASFIAPTGWTRLGTVNSGSGNVYSRAYKKIASNEPASEVWTLTGSASVIGISIAAFAGGHDVLHWSGLDTVADATMEAYALQASRDGVAYHVAAWRNTTTAATVSPSFGTETHDVNSNNAATIYRGQAGYYYGPAETNDIVNAGDTMPSPVMTVSTTPVGGAAWSFLIGDKEADAETWSSTDGDFAVELKLDDIAVDTTGSITTKLHGDITGSVATISSRGDNPPNETDDMAADGLTSTKWLDNSATSFLKYDFGVGVTKTVRRYRITSANDNEARDPKDWTLDGSNDNSNWTTVDTRAGEAFGNRLETREFKLNGTAGAYRYYRLNITANSSSGATAVIQLAEFRVSEVDVWEDVTTYVTEEDKIRITRGVQDSSGRSDYSRAYLTLKNTDGRFSLKNSDSPYYGSLQRNTQMRISKAFGTKSLQLQGEVDVRGSDMTGDGARCPMTDSLMIVGDIDIRIDFEPKSWRDQQMLCGFQVPEGAPEAWSLSMDDSGILHLTWNDGVGNFFDVSSEVPVPQVSRRQAIRVTLDVDNGATGNDLKFYTSDTISGSWTQLGSTITTSGVTALGYSGGALCVGHVPGRGMRGIHGLVYNFELYTGIAGTAVTDVDFTALSNGVHTWTDSNSNNWITVNNAVVSNRRYRFHGEVSEWPLYWDSTGNWVTTSVTGAGVQKRLERGKATSSVMKRYHTKGLSPTPSAFKVHATAYAYWPMEDGSGATSLASGLPSKPSMFIYGNPLFEEQDGEVFHESDGLLKINSTKYGGPVQGLPSGYIDLRWIQYSPTFPVGAQVMELYTTGTLKRFLLSYPSTGNLRLQGYNENDLGTIAWDTGSKATAIEGTPVHCQLILDQSGSNIAVTFNCYNVYGTLVANWTDTFVVASMGRVYRININPTNYLVNTYIGHVAIYGEEGVDVGTPAFAGGELNAHNYETAGERIKRICDEEGIEFRYSGALDTSLPVGYQDSDTPFNIMSSAAVSDDGYLTDPLDAFGISYQTGRSLYNQPAAVSVSYTGNELSGELLPVEDDSYINNDFTADRGGAGSARFQEEDGPLSVNSPPDGVGPYDDSQSYSLANDAQCRDIASWQVHKGTLDEERYPKVELALENLRIAANTSLTEDILLLDVGQRLDITNTPSFLPADDIRQIVIGYEETFDNFQHGFTLNTLPERAFEVAEYDHDYRFEQYGSVLYQDITAAATSVRVDNTPGLPWSATAADFDVIIDGERITVTSVANQSATYSTDTFDRADSTTNLGSTNGGTVSAWTQKVGTWGINSNQAYISAAATSVATIPGSADFEEVSFTVSSWASGAAGVVFRLSDTSNYWWFGGTVGSNATLNSVIAGATTTYQVAGTDGATFVLAAGDKLSVRAHGSVIECFRNGILFMTKSSASLQTNTLVGMYLTTTVPRINNFTWINSDPDQTLTVTRGVNGVSATHRAGATVKLYQTPYRGV